MTHASGSQPSPTDGVGRRWFVIGGAVLVVAGAGAGTAVKLTRDDEGTTSAPQPPPAQLVAAQARERGLIADLDATTGGSAAVRALLVRARADHAAHLQAVQALLADYERPSPSPSPSPSPTPAGSARTRAQLRAAEARASAAAASAAAKLDDRAAALLASIAACEATHAAVLA